MSRSDDDFDTWLARMLERMADGRKVFGTAFSVRHKDRVYGAAAGDFDLHTPFFIASTTKLFTTALILQLRQAGALELDSPISRFLGSELLQGLHVLRGQSHADALTVRHLLAHTSGLPDYFQGADRDGARWDKKLLGGQDFAWTTEHAVAHARQIGPAFLPGTPGKALYSDTNFQLLGRIAEVLRGQPLAACYAQGVCEPLRLRSTYLYADPTDTTPRDIFYRRKPLHMPLAMASFGADGGIVSTAPELLRFVDAFFSGKLFPRAMLDELQAWNPIFFPLESGVGLHRFRLPWLFNPLRRVPPLLGHSGLSGALAYHCPQRDVSIAGTVNQIDSPSTSFRLTVQILTRTMRP